MDFQQLLQSITPDIYQNLKKAVEIGKWPDGRPLTAEQRELCLQAVIAYDQRNKSEQDRVGYMPPKETPCDTDHDHGHDSEKPLVWKQ